MVPGNSGQTQFQRVALPNAELLEEEPLYVNAKQYRRILKRRQARAKLEAEGKIPKERPVSIFSFFSSKNNFLCLINMYLKSRFSCLLEYHFCTEYKNYMRIILYYMSYLRNVCNLYLDYEERERETKVT